MANSAISELIAWAVTQDIHFVWEMKQSKDGHLIPLRDANYARARSVIVHDRALRSLEQ
ncbi:hypothetical protein LMG33818_000024 [Halomonadaceae bacterium LMG 33818]